MKNILLGLTGSVASILYVKLIEELSKIGTVTVILTKNALSFIDVELLKSTLENVKGSLLTDDDEWTWNGTHKWKQHDSILHIKLRNTHSAFVIAPCSANTLAKISNGICDNLLTTVARAWDRNRLFLIAPSMNTEMWNHPITEQQLSTFKSFGNNNSIARPQSKMLACGTNGMGALADISLIKEIVEDTFIWNFPLEHGCSGIPIGNHPGAFLAKRKHHIHTGVDLYTHDGALVHAVEDGTIVGTEHFTGQLDGSPWWNDTDCVLVEGTSGVVLYGEVKLNNGLKIGDKVNRKSWIASVKQVLKDHKLRPDIMGHSLSMLHMELYPYGKYTAIKEWGENPDNLSILRDPTPYLISSVNAPTKLLTHNI